MKKTIVFLGKGLGEKNIGGGMKPYLLVKYALFICTLQGRNASQRKIEPTHGFKK